MKKILTSAMAILMLSTAAFAYTEESSESTSGETKKPKTENVANDSVITFTPSPKKEDGTKINISTQTRAFDLTGELAKLPTDSDSDTNDQVQLEKDDFEDFIPETEVDFEKNANSFIRKYSLQKRNS